MKATYIAAAILASTFAFGCGEEPQLMDPGAAPTNLAPNAGKTPNRTNDPNRDGSPTNGGDNGSTPSPSPSAATGGQCEDGTTCAAGQACVSGTNLCTKAGAFRITLSWETALDLDLHVVTPRNEELYYRNRVSSDGGEFTQDGCIAGRCEQEQSPFGESVVWGDFATPGTYEIWAVNYNGGESVPFVIEVEFEGEREVFQGTVGGGRGEASSVHAFTIEGVAPENPNSDTACKQQLDQLGIPYRNWSYSTQSAGGSSCTVEEPITITGPINGVTYQYLNTSPGTMNMTCDMALALHRLGDVLKEKNINKVKHIGTFNCRNISGSSSLSQHSYGHAIDLWEFVGVDGTNYSLERDWQHNTSSPTTHKAQVLHYIGRQMHERRIFNIVLTPNFNSDHDNHFHVDLKAGSHYLRSTVDPEYFFDDLPYSEGCGHAHEDLDGTL